MRLRVWFVGAICLVFCSLARAEVDRNQAASAKAAAEQFAVLSKDSKATGVVPRLREPATGSLFAKVFRREDVRSPTFQDLSALAERMAAGVRVGEIYMLAGTGVSELSQLSGNPNASHKMNLNIIKYEPEMARFYDFQMFMQGAMIDALLRPGAGEGARALQNMAAPLKSIGIASKNVASGLIEIFAVNGISDSWRRERLAALLANAPKYAKFLEPAQRSELRDVALACADVMDDPAVAGGLKHFAKIVSPPR
jgi:hypothetical protein